MDIAYTGEAHLVLFGKRHVPPAELTHVPAVPAKAVCADLCGVKDVSRTQVHDSLRCKRGAAGCASLR